jgi:hypothetical protein
VLFLAPPWQDGGHNARDELSIVNNGGVELDGGRPNELLGGGQHFDDVANEEFGNRVSPVQATSESSRGWRFPPNRHFETAPEKMDIIIVVVVL